MTGVANVQTFVEGYRGHKLEVEQRAGVEHLVIGQHEAIWADDRQEIIELSYVPLDGHSFNIILLDAETLQPHHMARVDVVGLHEGKTPDGWTLSDDMRQAVLRLKTSVQA